MQFYSQASQDEFAYLMLYKLLKQTNHGYFLDIGAGHAVGGNNTFFLEKNFQWHGVGIDMSFSHAQSWATLRKNPLFIGDATKFNYTDILKVYPKDIDYLSLDIDEYYDEVLKKLPFDRHTFKVITIEHDYYRYGERYRQAERDILNSHGYYLLAPNVRLSDNIGFEDWWIHPAAFPADLMEKLKELKLESKDHREIISAIQALIPS